MTQQKAVIAVALLAALSPQRASAKPIEQGTFALGAERLTGMFHVDEKVGGGPSAGDTTLSLLGNSATSPIAGAWQFPRVGLDGFIIDGLSLGGSLAVLHRSFDGGSNTDVLVAPRVGFGFMFSRVVGIWPRGGLSYWHSSVSADAGPDTTRHAFAFDLDVPLLIAPVRNFAITVGPVFDVSFDGKQGVSGGPDQDISFTQFGLSAGIVGLL